MNDLRLVARLPATLAGGWHLLCSLVANATLGPPRQEHSTMNSTPQAVASPKQLLDIAVRHPMRWLIPAIVTVAATGVYALVRQTPWEASQALVVRNDAANNQETLGKFAQPEEMKTVQETILELARSSSVLGAALAEVGPPPACRADAAAWPGEEDVADLREAVKLTPPKGAEFGKTEVFYLKVRDRDRARAVALASALAGQIEARFQRLREAKAASMVGEVEQAVELAAKDLRESTARLSGMERQVGSDLAELRILHDTTSGESALRRTVTEIRNELRQIRAAGKSDEELLKLLKLAQAEPDRLVAMPNTLLQSQSALRRLKDGLVDAQLAASQLLGRMSADHPLVKAAHESQKQIARQVHGELTNAIGAVEVDLRINADRALLLDEQLAVATGRLDKLAALRAPYANQVAETRKWMELMERAQQRLADARASQATAKATSLIARIDAPETGTRPVGPGRAVLLVLGLAGGLVIGFGVLVLSIDAGQLAPPAAAPSSVPAGSTRTVRSNDFPSGNLTPSDRDGSLTSSLKLLATAQGRRN
jgi:uncharacterized protein involved in exopolysaccharide biosynthesis